MEKSELQRAKMLVFWDRYEMVFLSAALFVVGLVLGAYGNSYQSSVERMALMRSHDDQVRDFRMSCRKTVDERDKRVLEATDAATKAAQAVAEALDAEDAGNVTKPARPPAPPPAPPKPPRKPPADLGAAVRDANAVITGAQR